MHLLDGFGSYGQNQMAINGSVNFDRPRHSTKKRARDTIQGAEMLEETNCVTSCLSCFKTKTNDSKLRDQEVIDWVNMTTSKLDKVFRSGQDYVPEWLNGFQEEFFRQMKRTVDQVRVYKTEFAKLLRTLVGKRHKKLRSELLTPKLNPGTVKSYLSEV